MPPNQIGELYGVQATLLPALLDMVREPYDGPSERYSVSTRENSVRNGDPDILLPVPESGLF